MNKNLLQILLPILLWLTQGILVAQNISIPYFCGFEDPVDNLEWQMNVGASDDATDQWMISNIDYSEGSKALTISCDGGKKATFGSNRNMIVAYRRMKMDTSITVNVSFDWKCEGIEDVAQLNFYFLPAGAVIDESELKSLSNSADLPRRLSRPMGMYYGSNDWENSIAIEQLSLNANDEYYMIFVWQNANTDTTTEVLSTYSVSVDNIQITSAACPEPENLQYKSACDTLFISWEGYTELYECQYKVSGDLDWKSLPKTKEKEVILPGLKEGAYDVRVRGLNETTNDISAWRTLSEAICFCPDRHCINYVDLYGEGVSCWYGEAADPTQNTFIVNAQEGVIDYGSRDIRSRHTVNWKQGETDPRTGNKLHTIPEGSLASVRLGNWDNGKQAESIEFDHIVDTAQADIILMKYAVVLEAPDHGPTEDPYFNLKILDANRIEIDPECGSFDFTPMNKDIEWQDYGGYKWKDWTAIGLNLSAYHELPITICLTTQDCTRSAHCGYAYFTLDCVDASLKSTSCGETIDMKVEAPDGFDYKWTRGEDRVPVEGGDQNNISIPADDIETYYCEVDYKGLEGCGFELHTEVKPRFPFADFDWEHKPEDCQNKIVLKNKSCVHTRIDGEDTPTEEKCEEYYWRIKDGNDEYEYISENVEYAIPDEGATLEVTLVSYLSSQACEDDTTLTISVPAIYPHYDDTVDVILCEDVVYYQFEGGVYGETGVHDVFLKNQWGCDSVRTLNLQFVSPPDTAFISDTICYGDTLIFKDKKLTTSYKYEFSYPNEEGCDSVFVVALEVVEPLGVYVSDEYNHACADDSRLCIKLDSTEGMRFPIEYSLYFDNLAKNMGFADVKGAEFDKDNMTICFDIPKNCSPNKYNVAISFIDTIDICGEVSVDVDFDIYYSSSILESKFGNLITIYDSAYNGGYSFVENAYRWYKNDELLVGDTLSFVYLGDDEVFNEEDCYYVELTRKSDGVVMRTCPICPGMGTDIEHVYVSEQILPITLFEKNQDIIIENLGEGVVELYTLTGQHLDTYKIGGGDNTIVAPSQSGLYLLRVILSDYVGGYKIRVK